MFEPDRLIPYIQFRVIVLNVLGMAKKPWFAAAVFRLKKGVLDRNWIP